MKLPRWLVIVMLATSVLALFVGPGWWWVTWPERTAREFVELIAAGDDEQAGQLMLSEERGTINFTHGFTEQMSPDWNASDYRPRPRTVWDLITGRQRFDFGPIDTLEVQWGTVQIGRQSW